MIHGIGFDLVDIRRVKRSFDRFGERLARRLLSEPEYSQFEAHSAPEFFLAKHFAAKEAVVKALGTGFRNGIAFKQISINHTADGQPVLEYSGVVLAMMSSRGIQNSFLTLSDECNFACACVVLEK